MCRARVPVVLLAQHRAIVSGAIHRHAALARDLVGQLHRETMRIVELERHLARNLVLARLLQRIQLAREQIACPAASVWLKRALFGADDIDDLVAPRRQLVIVALIRPITVSAASARKGRSSPSILP